jgi:hypothetical protein
MPVATGAPDFAEPIFKGRVCSGALIHTTLRRFEAELIRHLGFEIFVPKVIPDDEANKSASVDFPMTRR